MQFRAYIISLFSSLMLMGLLCRCASVNPTGVYDPIADQMMTTLHQKLTRHFIQLQTKVGTPAAAYAQYIEFYEDIKVDLASLQLRLSVPSERSIPLQQLQKLTEMVQQWEQLHQMGLDHVAQIKPVQASFDASFRALLTYQMALLQHQKHQKE